MQYSIEKQKSLGAFYTPPILAEYLAKKVLSMKKFDNEKTYIVLDPATGESALLQAFLTESRKKGLRTDYIGIDIEQAAIEKSKKTFSSELINHTFLKSDALYPYQNMKSNEGWIILSKKYFPNGIDFIVCNPPWGAEKNSYKKLSIDFETAKGQFDIYDLFLELSIKTLNKNGCFGFIVPDTIYNEEHRPIRQFLFENTTIKHIVRLGEGIFPDVNIAVSLIFGIKAKCKNTHMVSCVHISNNLKNRVIKGEMTLDAAIKLCTCKIPSKMMVENDFAFITDITKSDSHLAKVLSNCPKVGDITNSQRGVELSKKGIVLLCPYCQKYFPSPRSLTNKTTKCPHCQHQYETSCFSTRKIISDIATNGYKQIIVGEDVFRYTTKAKHYIEYGLKGINYKDIKLYHGSKILVRKTGVGITAGIDYNNCLTNQVVYIIKRKADIDPTITNEVVLAVLNSRIITYFIIKMMGSNGWKTHAYLSQNSVASLPFPNIDINNVATRTCLIQITELVRSNSLIKYDNLSPEVDAKIEYLVSRLFGLEENDYGVIYKAIREVQQMIPFKRLLNLSIKEIFSNGI
jgi:adenine-specific DNA-methyltransferase